MLGKGLHTLQDFYAHSNWVDQYQSDTRADFITEYVENDNVFSSARTAALAAPAPTKDRDAGAGDPPGGGSATGRMCRPRTASTSLQFSFGSQTWAYNDGNFDLIALPGVITSSAWWYDTAIVDAGTAYSAAASDGPDARCDHGVSDKNFTNLGLRQNYGGSSKFSGIAKDMPNWPLTATVPEASKGGPQGRRTGALEPTADDYSLDDGDPTLGTVWAGAINSAKARAAADATCNTRLPRSSPPITRRSF